MPVYNMLQAKTHLSKIVESVESGASDVVIARNGKPVARLVAFEPINTFPKRLGMFDGQFPSMNEDEFNALDDHIAELFNGEPA